MFVEGFFGLPKIVLIFPLMCVWKCTEGDSEILIRTSKNYISKVFYNKGIYYNELEILKRLQHDNIINVHTYFIDEYGKGIIEFKYYTDGDLLDHINKYVRTKKKCFTTDKKINILIVLLNPPTHRVRA